MVDMLSVESGSGASQLRRIRTLEFVVRPRAASWLFSTVRSNMP